MAGPIVGYETNDGSGNSSIGRSFMEWPSFTFPSWMPTAIRRFVIAIRINPIDVIGRIRAFAHICKEVFKSLPAFTDGDSSSSVVFERILRWNCASTPHALPNAVGWSWPDHLFGISGLSVSSGGTAYSASLETPAAIYFTRSQMITTNSFLGTASAYAEPIVPCDLLYYGESSKGFSSKVDNSSHAKTLE
jgi:hypothetical protein